MASRKIRANGGYSTGIAARVASLNQRSLQRWIDNGLIRPSIFQGSRRGEFDLFSFSDLVMLRAISQLRQSGFSLASIRKALAALEQIRRRRKLENVHLIGMGKDIQLWQGEQATSLLQQPGQMAFRWAINLGQIQQEVRAALKDAA